MESVRQLLRHPTQLPDIKGEAKDFLRKRFYEEHKELHDTDLESFNTRMEIYVGEQIREWKYFRRGPVADNPKIQKRLKKLEEIFSD